MNKAILTVLVLSLAISLAQAHSSQAPQGRFLSSKSGSVMLFNDDRGYYAYADFKYDIAHADDYLNVYSQQVLIALTSSRTLLSKDCLYFAKYNCSLYDCNVTSEVSSASYPYFTASGKLASTYFYVEYNNWYLKGQSLLADSCSNGGSPFSGMYTKGLLGMGLGDDGYKNLFGSQIFSVFLDKNEKLGGSLVFSNDFGYAKYMFSNATFYTDKNWKIDLTNGEIGVGTTSTPKFNSKMVFDLAADSIGLPSRIFYEVLSQLNTHGLSCTVIEYGIYIGVQCTYSGSDNALPKLYIRGSGMEIVIPPEVYVKESTYTKGSNITVFIRPTGSNYTGKLYVTPEYDNTILLGTNVMKYYYTVFDNSDTSKQLIKIYQAGENPYKKSDNHLMNNIIILIIIVCFGLLFRWCKNKRTSAVQEPLVQREQGAAHGTFVPNGARNVRFGVN